MKMRKAAKALGCGLLVAGLGALLQAMGPHDLLGHGLAGVVMIPGVALTTLGNRLVPKRRRRRRSYLSDFATRC